ncbi:hypothetical protein PsYK624_046540 [Phanerochaete sordida]|uniref:Uncharacterized protein n=1 Tax=Phanerochaete sordida TaxID=48140 RepID=A0A9P3LAM3_9APHY|nr:hypothetical protein PsYK624_046540 [Phanerochaete sordida]
MRHWVLPYIELVEKMRRFDHMFIEPELRRECRQYYRACRSLTRILGALARVEALLLTVDPPKRPSIHVPAPSMSQRRSASGPSTPHATSPMPYTVPGPMPGMHLTPAHYHHQGAVAGGSALYRVQTQYNPSSSSSVPVSMPLNVSIPPSMPYRQQVASPLQMSPYSQASPTLVGYPGPSHSRPGSSGSVSSLSQRPPSSTIPRVVSAPAPSAAASVYASSTSTPDVSASAPVKRKSKPKRIITEDFMMEDVEWYREQKEKQKEAQLDTIQTDDSSATAVAPLATGPPNNDRAVVATEAETRSPVSQPDAGPDPTDRLDAQATERRQDVHMADGTSLDSAILVDSPTEITMPAESQTAPVAQSLPGDSTEADENDGETLSVVPPANADGVATDTLSDASMATAFVAPPPPMLDLVKLGSPTELKATKPLSNDLVYSKVPPPVTTPAAQSSEPSATPTSVIDPRSAPNSLEDTSEPSSSEQMAAKTRFSHIVKKTTSRKGPPGVRELAKPAEPSSTSTTSNDSAPSSAGITLQSKAGSGLRLRLLPPKPPRPSSPTPEVSDGEIPSPTVSPTSATTAKGAISSDSEDEEPLFLRQRRASGQQDSPIRKRARSGSPDTPLAQRRKSMQGSPRLSRIVPPAIRTQPREYTVDAFASGSFVYSPIQAVAPKRVDDSAEVGTNAAERDGSPATLPPSLSRAIGPSRIRKPTRPLEEMGLDSAPFSDDDLDVLSTFRDGSRILGFARGKPPGDTARITFKFQLEPEEYDACVVWSKQSNHSELVNDPTQLRCLSLSCYHFDDINRKREALGNPTQDELFADRPNAFPSHQRVQLRIDGEQPVEFGVTWGHLWINKHDQIVDLSKNACLGTNSIELYAGHPDADHTPYAFVLRLHPLTPRQLAWWWARKRHQVTWEQSLRSLSRIEVPPVDLSRRAKLVEQMQV